MNRFHRGSWLVTVPLAGLTAAYVMLIYLPGRQTMQELLSDLESKQQTIAQSGQLESQSQLARAELGGTLDYLRACQQRWHVGRNPATLFATISGEARAAGVRTTRFEPGTTVEYLELHKAPLTLGASGTFADVCKLLSSLERLPQLMWIEEFQLQRGSESGRELQCELKLAIFADKSDISN